MFRAIVCALVVATLAAVPVTESKPPVTPKTKSVEEKTIQTVAYLQDISVMVVAGDYSGSGVVKVTKDNSVWVWTCAHILVPARHVDVDVDGVEFVTFDDVVIQIEARNREGRLLSVKRFVAEVVRYSEPVFGEDIALLLVKDKRFKPKNSVKFDLSLPVPLPGSTVLHCGSYLGLEGYNSIAVGHFVQAGRKTRTGHKLRDQIQCPTYHGSSGGIVCDGNGCFIGTLTNGYGETFSLMVPLRTIVSWAKANGVMFAIDDSLPVPSYEDLLANGIETK